MKPSTLPNFERLGGDFSNRGWAHDPVFHHALENLVVEMPPGTWLEVGCGTGDFTQFVQRPDVRVLGIDLSFNMLQSAKARRVAITEIHADAHVLPIRSGSVSAAFSRNVLKHCSDPALVLNQMARSCSDDGRILVVESCAADDADRMFMDQLIAMAEPHQARSRTPSEWSQLLTASGIIIEDQRVFTHKVVATASYLQEQFGLANCMLADYFQIFSNATPAVRRLKQIKVSGIETLQFLLFWTVLFGRVKKS